MTNTNNSKKVSKIQLAILLRTIIPMIIMGIMIIVAVYYGYVTSIRKEMENSLTAVAASVAGAYDEMYPGDYMLVGENIISIYKGSKEINGEYSMIDRVKKETGMDVSLFYQNTRVLTTLQDTYGSRYIETGINAGLYNAVSNSEESLCYKVDIDGVMYYACYLPLFNSNESFTGIIATAIKQEEVFYEALDAALPILIITLIAVIFATVISYEYTKSVADAILNMCKFLKGMIDGKLDNEISNEVLKRNDEIGETAKFIIKMQQAIKVLVERDPLTALYNRRCGAARLKNIQKRAVKSGLSYSVCICDIDFFKKVNDGYGHAAGDAVLKKVADIMRKTTQGKGFVARWGGEEFLIVFDKMGLKAATKELKKLLDTIRKTEIWYENFAIKITMTFGVVEGDNNDDYGILLRHADERLYYGKSNGRNQVVFYDESDKEIVNNHNEKQIKTKKSVKSDNYADDNKNDIVDKALEEDQLETEFLSVLVQKLSDQLIFKTEEDEKNEEDEEYEEDEENDDD